MQDGGVLLKNAGRPRSRSGVRVHYSFQRRSGRTCIRRYCLRKDGGTTKGARDIFVIGRARGSPM